jgi:hypothetical protein
MILDFNKILTDDDFQEINRVAEYRTNQQIDDSIDNHRARYSFGAPANIEIRDKKQRCDDHCIGAIAECITAKLLGVPWTKEERQYDTGKSDLNFFGVPVEVRGSRTNGIIIRPKRDFLKSKKNTLLVAITNLSDNSLQSEAVWTFLGDGDIKTLCTTNPHWLCGKDSTSPYYSVPIKELNGDFYNFDKINNSTS